MDAKNKNFKPGDLVTSIRFAKNRKGVVCRQKNTGSHVDGFGNVFVCFGDDGEWIQEHYLFHGHNVKMEITGEELPERLRVEEVRVTIKKPISEAWGLDFGDPIRSVRGILEMPAHLAKEYCEWIKEQE